MSLSIDASRMPPRERGSPVLGFSCTGLRRCLRRAFGSTYFLPPFPSFWLDWRWDLERAFSFVFLNPDLPGLHYTRWWNRLRVMTFFVLNKFIYLFIYLFIYFWPHWVFVAARGPSLVAASKGYSLLWCAGFSLRWLLLLQSMSSRHAGFSSCGTWAQ